MATPVIPSSKLPRRNQEFETPLRLWRAFSGMKKKAVLIMAELGSCPRAIGVGGTGLPAGTTAVAQCLLRTATSITGSGEDPGFSNLPITVPPRARRIRISSACRLLWAGTKIRGPKTHGASQELGYRQSRS